MAVSVFWPSVQIDFFPDTLSHRISLLLFRVFFDKWSKVSCTARSVSVYLAKYKRTPCNYSFSSTLLLLCLPLLTVELRQAGGSLIVDFYIFGGILLETPQRDIAREVYSRQSIASAERNEKGPMYTKHLSWQTGLHKLFIGFPPDILDQEIGIQNLLQNLILAL